VVGKYLALLLAVGVSACSGAEGGNNAARANDANEAELAGTPEPLNDAEAAALADEAAADEAADTTHFGGNAAAAE
jgi:hypothetical protein